ncbi:MAG TPA: bifunctional hydroxymethylpyrimidine kinase/phosphomethylpyrimidine kinase [Candidatus Binataceae bacterium]|jgi:hydroxymethylpyrimidine/phosphomethylpyrimidine kinase|nr:bifunctional hydroxymethylpyrimidine kinase/phosphomethylpyrimidine kinase [Candidatus Binataceae bacterium]
MEIRLSQAGSARRRLKVALAIGGSDPGGGAGIQADLKTFAACGVYGYSALTAVIAQNSSRVNEVAPVDARLLRSQLALLVEEYPPDAVKIGALATAANVRAVARAIAELKLPNPVIDPVMVSTSGVALLDKAGAAELISELLPRAALVTPNLPEAEALGGMAIASAAAMRAAARAIRRLGPRAVLIKGGHPLRRADGRGNDRIVDLLFDGRRFVEFSGARIGAGAHGTGCAFAAAITAFMARGFDLEDAIRRARRFMNSALRESFTLGGGRPLLDHFAGWPRQAQRSSSSRRPAARL